MVSLPADADSVEATDVTISEQKQQGERVGEGERLPLISLDIRDRNGDWLTLLVLESREEQSRDQTTGSCIASLPGAARYPRTQSNSLGVGRHRRPVRRVFADTLTPRSRCRSDRRQTREGHCRLPGSLCAGCPHSPGPAAAVEYTPSDRKGRIGKAETDSQLRSSKLHRGVAAPRARSESRCTFAD